MLFHLVKMQKMYVSKRIRYKYITRLIRWKQQNGKQINVIAIYNVPVSILRWICEKETSRGDRILPSNYYKWEYIPEI